MYYQAVFRGLVRTHGKNSKTVQVQISVCLVQIREGSQHLNSDLNWKSNSQAWAKKLEEVVMLVDEVDKLVVVELVLTVVCDVLLLNVAVEVALVLVTEVVKLPVDELDVSVVVVETVVVKLVAVPVTDVVDMEDVLDVDVAVTDVDVLVALVVLMLDELVLMEVKVEDDVDMDLVLEELVLV